MVLCLGLPTLSVPASAHSILWVSTSDHTDLVKDEEYEAVPAELFMVLGVDDVASGSVECVDGGLEILYEDLIPLERDGVEEELVPPEPISVEEEPETLEEIELEEITNDQIQEP